MPARVLIDLSERWLEVVVARVGWVHSKRMKRKCKSLLIVTVVGDVRRSFVGEDSQHTRDVLIPGRPP
jgi:hypothetical protein